MAKTEDELRAQASKAQGQKITHGTWNKNPGNIKGYRADGKPTDFTKWLDKQGIPYTKGTKASDGGWFIKFENDADGLKAADNFWNVVKTWGPYKGKTVKEALATYAADGYDQKFLDSLEAKGIDLNVPLDSLPADSLATISHHQMQTEDPNQYANLQSQGYISSDGMSTYTPRVMSSATTVEQEGNPNNVGKGSQIKNKDNLDYLKRRASEGGYELSDEDSTKITDLAEEQRVQWSKLGKPGLMDLAKNALGIGPKKLGVDDDMSNAVMRQQVIKSLSSDINVNTPEGKKRLRARLKAYTDLIGSDEYKDKVASLAGSVRDTSYENMIEDLSADYRLFISDANKQLGLEGNDAIGYEIKSEEFLDKSFDKEGVISDNKAIIQEQLDKGNKEIIDDVAKRGMDAVAQDLADAQADAASRNEDADPITLLNIKKAEDEKAARDKAFQEGVEGAEALALQDDDTEEEEEQITTDFDLWKKDNPEGTLEEWMARDKGGDDGSGGDDTDRMNKMRKAEKILSGLKAAAGVLSLSKALKDPEVDIPEISPLVMEAVEKQRVMAKSGLTAKEKSAAMQGMNDAYAGAMKNVLRASGGQRGMFLANQGTVDANRIRGLNQLAAEDAAVKRQNIQQYNQLATSVGQMKLQRDMTAEQMKQSAMAQNRQLLGGIGSNLVSDALSDLSWYMNPNRDLIEQAQRGALENIVGTGDNKYDPNADYNVKGGNFKKQETDAEKAQKANQKAIDNLNKPS